MKQEHRKLVAEMAGNKLIIYFLDSWNNVNSFLVFLFID